MEAPRSRAERNLRLQGVPFYRYESLTKPYVRFVWSSPATHFHKGPRPRSRMQRQLADGLIGKL
jgi:hypothetical protein